MTENSSSSNDLVYRKGKNKLIPLIQSDNVDGFVEEIKLANNLSALTKIAHMERSGEMGTVCIIQKPLFELIAYYEATNIIKALFSEFSDMMFDIERDPLNHGAIYDDPVSALLFYAYGIENKEMPECMLNLSNRKPDEDYAMLGQFYLEGLYYLENVRSDKDKNNRFEKVIDFISLESSKNIKITLASIAIKMIKEGQYELSLWVINNLDLNDSNEVYECFKAFYSKHPDVTPLKLMGMLNDNLKSENLSYINDTL